MTDRHVLGGEGVHPTREITLLSKLAREPLPFESTDHYLVLWCLGGQTLSLYCIRQTSLCQMYELLYLIYLIIIIITYHCHTTRGNKSRFELPGITFFYYFLYKSSTMTYYDYWLLRSHTARLFLQNVSISKRHSEAVMHGSFQEIRSRCKSDPAIHQRQR